MTERDYNAEAARKLPCECSAIDGQEPAYHLVRCPAFHRPAVAAWGEEIAAEGRAELGRRMDTAAVHYGGVIAQLKSELAAAREELGELGKLRAENTFLRGAIDRENGPGVADQLAAAQAQAKAAREQVAAELETQKQANRLLGDGFNKMQSDLAAAREELSRMTESRDNWRASCKHVEGERDAAQAQAKAASDALQAIKSKLHKEAGYKVDRCACIFAADDELVAECEFHKDRYRVAREIIQAAQEVVECWNLKSKIGAIPFVTAAEK